VIFIETSIFTEDLTPEQLKVLRGVVKEWLK
jgi:hypothetical protein